LHYLIIKVRVSSQGIKWSLTPDKRVIKLFILLLFISSVLGFFLSYDLVCGPTPEHHCVWQNYLQHKGVFYPLFTGALISLTNSWPLVWTVEIILVYLISCVASKTKYLKLDWKVIVMTIILAAIFYKLTFYYQVNFETFPNTVCYRYFLYSNCYSFVTIPPIPYLVRLNYVFMIFICYLLSNFIYLLCIIFLRTLYK